LGQSSFATPPTTATRNDTTGSFGFEFQVTQNITVSRLGRLYVAQNTQDHVLRLWQLSVGQLASGTVLTASASDASNFKWVSITPIMLTPGPWYALTEDDTSGGDDWKDLWSAAASMQSVFSKVSSAWTGTQGQYPVNGGQNQNGEMFGTPALWYSASSRLLSLRRKAVAA
jgi:hypothetical protein